MFWILVLSYIITNYYVKKAPAKYYLWDMEGHLRAVNYLIRFTIRLTNLVTYHYAVYVNCFTIFFTLYYKCSIHISTCAVVYYELLGYYIKIISCGAESAREIVDTKAWLISSWEKSWKLMLPFRSQSLQARS